MQEDRDLKMGLWDDGLMKNNYKLIAITYILLVSIFTGIEVFNISNPLFAQIFFGIITVLNLLYAL